MNNKFKRWAKGKIDGKMDVDSTTFKLNAVKSKVFVTATDKNNKQVYLEGDIQQINNS